jgi:plasmid stability protein
MGQMTIRRLDDAKMLRLKAKAKEQGTSVEALARSAIHREAVALTVEEKLALVDRMQAITRRLMVPGVKQTPAEVLIRESRDFDH